MCYCVFMLSCWLTAITKYVCRLYILKWKLNLIEIKTTFIFRRRLGNINSIQCDVKRHNLEKEKERKHFFISIFFMLCSSIRSRQQHCTQGWKKVTKSAKGGVELIFLLHTTFKRNSLFFIEKLWLCSSL